MSDLLPVSRTVRIGGMVKSELIAELQRNGIQINEAARHLFAHSGFTTADTVETLATIECSVRDLGFTNGAIIDEIHRRGARLGLSLCPLELGPHLRLQFRDQPEGALGHPPSRYCAPPGSLTIASAALTDDDDTPKGFYLRNIHGTLWLRGYRSGPAHTWSSADRFVFCDAASLGVAL
jgi:hypothetical protein